jgi:enolase
MYVLGHKGRVDLGMDVAASEFWNAEKKVYDLDFKVRFKKEIY